LTGGGGRVNENSYFIRSYRMKYKNTPVAYNPVKKLQVVDFGLTKSEKKQLKNEGYYFLDSKFECEVYQKLLLSYEPTQIKLHPVYSFPDFPLKFCPDFIIQKDLTSFPELVIEAKGMMTSDFPLRLFIFLTLQPSFRKIYTLVFGSPENARKARSNKLIQYLIKSGIKVISIDDLSGF
jgi:hypothetical protein